MILRNGMCIRDKEITNFVNLFCLDVEFIPDGSPHYYPILYFNDYWNMNSDYMPINESTP